VAQAVLAWRATDGFSAGYAAFTGGTAAGQWRPTPPAFGAMSAQGLAFTGMFALVSNTQFIGNTIYTNITTNLPLAAALTTIPIMIMIIYLLIARRLGAFEHV